MEDYKKSEIVSGLFVCIAIVVLGLFAFRVGTFDLWGLFKGEALVCRANFLDVKTLASGAEVKVAGEPVGNVTNVQMVESQLTDEHVRLLRGTLDESMTNHLQAGMRRQLIEVTFELTDPRLKLHVKSARVSLGRDSLITMHYLDLDPGVWPSGEDPKTIVDANFKETQPVLPTREQSDFEELVALAKPVIRQAESALVKINTHVLTKENAGWISKGLENFGSLLVETRTTVRNFDARVMSPENLDRVRNILGDLERASEAGRAAFKDLAQLLDRQSGSKLHEALDELAVASGKLDDRLDAVQADLQLALRGANDIVVDNSASLNESVRRLRRAMWQAEMALRKIRANPSVLLFGDDETDYQAGQPDESASRASGRAPPYGQRSEVQND